MANFGDFKGVFNTVISYLKSIDRSLRCLACNNEVGPVVQITASGDQDTYGAADKTGFRSISIVKTSPSGDTVVITTSDSNTYVLTELGEVFTDAATTGFVLPTINISGTGTFKYHGIK